MLVHKIAGLKVGIEYNHPTMINQSAAYVIPYEETDFDVVATDMHLKAIKMENSDLSDDTCEYIATSMIFYRKLVDFNGMLLHSSAVIKDGYAYMFSAPSGTGKSTHTGLWLKAFPDAEIINDDKPALCVMEDGVYVCGTPWSGKTSLNLNKCVPLGGICFIERSEENYIKEISTTEAIPMILNQTLRPKLKENMDKLLTLLEKIVEKADVYKMGCNISEDAAIMAYNKMKKS